MNATALCEMVPASGTDQNFLAATQGYCSYQQTEGECISILQSVSGGILSPCYWQPSGPSAGCYVISEDIPNHAFTYYYETGCSPLL